MSNNSASSIRTNLNSQLGEISELQDVVIGRSFDFSGFPACRFFLTSVENNLLAAAAGAASHYMRHYTFTVQIIQETTSRTKVQAEGDLEDAVDAVLDKLGTEWILDNNADNSRVEAGDIVEVEGPQGPMIVASITFTVQTFIE